MLIKVEVSNVSLSIFVGWHNLFPSLHIHGLNAKNHFLPTPKRMFSILGIFSVQGAGFYTT
jgi:hypothetical protein